MAVCGDDLVTVREGCASRSDEEERLGGRSSEKTFPEGFDFEKVRGEGLDGFDFEKVRDKGLNEGRSFDTVREGLDGFDFENVRDEGLNEGRSFGDERGEALTRSREGKAR